MIWYNKHIVNAPKIRLYMLVFAEVLTWILLMLAIWGAATVLADDLPDRLIPGAGPYTIMTREYDGPDEYCMDVNCKVVNAEECGLNDCKDGACFPVVRHDCISVCDKFCLRGKLIKGK